MVEINPFKARSHVPSIDSAFARSAIEMVNFHKPSADHLQIDLCYGNALSCELLLDAGAKKLTVIENPENIFEDTQERLGHQASYMRLRVEELDKHYANKAYAIYALDCFHMFEEPVNAIKSIHESLIDGGSLVFNLSQPLFKSVNETEPEKQLLNANLQFYQKLFAASGSNNEVLATTISLMSEMISTSTSAYSKEKIELLFNFVDMKLVDYKEVLIKMHAKDQQEMWRNMAMSFLPDTASVDDLVNSIMLPNEVNMRQAFYRLVK